MSRLSNVALIKRRLATNLAVASALMAVTACTTTENVHNSLPPGAAFFQHLSNYCGKSFNGRLVSSEEADAEMADMPLIMHVRTCSENEIRIPFHVGKEDGSWDRSRTWIITRTAAGMRLKHDHRHADGSNDKVTMYGGDTKDAGKPFRQEFYVDQESIDLFNKQGLPRSVTNIWAVEVGIPESDAPIFAYELRRFGANARFFRVEFDLSKEVATPPTPWGH